MAQLSFDITTLSGWSEWYKTATVGEHDLTVKAKADNWQTSDASTAVKLYIDSVSIDGAGLAEYEGVVKILRGTAYSYTFATLSDYYTFTGVTPTVNIGGTAYTDFTWNASTGKLDIPASAVTGNIAITLKAVGKSYAVTNTLTNCASNGADYVQYGTDYVTTITANQNYTLSATAPTVTIGGKPYAGATWVLGSLSNNGTLTIPGLAITGEVVITYAATARQYATNYTLTGCTTASQSTHTAVADVSLTFARSTGYEFGSTKPTVTFTPDGSSEATNISDLCTWTPPASGSSIATLVVPKKYAAGQLDIALTLAKQTFTVTKNGTNCTIDGAASVEYGASWSGMVAPAAGFTVASDKVTPVVTIGGTPYTEFTYAAGAPSATGTTYTLTIPANVITGNAIIAIEAAGQKLAAPQNVTVDGTTASWDEVENATSYELFSDGTSIGTYAPPTGYTVTFASNFSFSNASGYSRSATIVTNTGEQAKLSQASTKGLVWSGVISLTASGINDYVNDIDYTESGTQKTWDGSGTLTLAGDIIINSASFQCLTGDMLITLADGSQKRIDQLTLDDKVLSWNPDTMQLEADEITYTDSAENKKHTEYDIWTFSDGTVVKTVHRHRLYNVERQAMVYIDEWRIGEHAINIHGERIELVGHENVKEEVRHYTLFTKNQNYFVNGLLSGNRHTKEMHL